MFPLQPPEERTFSPQFYEKNRVNLIKSFKDTVKENGNSALFFIGDKTIPYQDSDIDREFQQEANFIYLFGAEIPDSYGFIDLQTGKAYCFIPDLNPYKMWMQVPTLQSLDKQHEVEFKYIDDIEKTLNQCNIKKLFFYQGQNTDSGHFAAKPDLDFLSKYEQNDTDLFDILNELRVIKNEEEIEMLRYVVDRTCDAHVFVMQNIKPGLKQFQQEALFKWYLHNKCGAKHVAYQCICCTGELNAVLHQHENVLGCLNDQISLSDMGTKYNGYCSDITVTYPINGKFSEKQKQIYDLTLKANTEVMKVLKPGVRYDDMHILAEKIILEELQKLGIVKEGNIDEIHKSRVSSIFMPHGLGHYIGLLTHDVGGYTKGQPQRSELRGMKNLRLRREMKKGMVVTVEPGCYFINFFIEESKDIPEMSKFLNYDKIAEYKHVGGVRIEDEVVLTENGCDNLSKKLPRTTEDIEKCMAK